MFESQIAGGSTNRYGEYFSDDAEMIRTRETVKIDASQREPGVSESYGTVRIATGGAQSPTGRYMAQYLQEINLEIDVGAEYDPDRVLVIESNVPFAMEASGGPAKNAAIPLNPRSDTSEFGIAYSDKRLPNYPSHTKLIGPVQPYAQNARHPAGGNVIRLNMIMERTEGTQRITVMHFIQRGPTP